MVHYVKPNKKKWRQRLGRSCSKALHKVRKRSLRHSDGDGPLIRARGNFRDPKNLAERLQLNALLKKRIDAERTLNGLKPALYFFEEDGLNSLLSHRPTRVTTTEETIRLSLQENQALEAKPGNGEDTLDYLDSLPNYPFR